MVATLTTFESILKEFYLGPVIEEINNEVHVLEMFEKATVDWQGRVAIIPVHVDRNTGVSFAAENAALPTAGAQGYARLQVNAKFQYGRFQITGPAISAAKSGGTGAFIGYVDAEMKKLVNDVRNSANGVSVFGNEIRGFLNQHIAGNAGAGTIVISGGAQTNVPANMGTFTFEYTGDYTPFLLVDAGTTSTWVPVRLIRMDNFKDVQLITTAGPGGVATNGNIFVSGIDTSLSTITLSYGSNDAAGAYFQTAGVVDGFGIGLALRFAQAVDSAGANFGVNGAALSQLQEPSGLFSNIASNGTVANVGEANPSAYFGLTRTSSTPPAAGEEAQLRGIVLTQAQTGAHARAALTLARMQQCLDRVYVDGNPIPTTTNNNVTEGAGITPNGGGHEHDVIMMNPTTRQQYTSLLQASLKTDTDKARGGDGGFLQLSYSGVPIKVGRAVPRGCLIFLRKDTWCITELEAAGFADLDGNVLSRIDDRDAYEGFYRWYYNVVCKQPNCNVILVGVSL
tara:strand:- start:2743 stop:4275 length:1533 start_codon:yes stop_codon:yes gene_type:complete